MYRERRDAMIAGLADHMPAGTTLDRTRSGGFFVWVTLPPGLDSQAMLPRAVTARVAYVPGTAFYADGFGSRHMRLSYCFPTPERIIEGTRRLGEVLHYEAGVLETFGTGRRAGPRARADAAARRPTAARPEPGLSEAYSGAETVVVLSGGLSHERDVSLRSGRRVARPCASRGVEVVESDVDSGLLPRLAELPGAVVFPVLHGEAGEDGALREVLALLGVPFVGSIGVRLPGRLRQVDRHHAWSPTPASRTPAQVALPHEIFRELGARRAGRGAGRPDRLPDDGQAVPRRVGARGAARCPGPRSCPSAMVGAYAYGPVAVIEEFVAGTEVAVAVVDRGDGPAALPAVEIRPDSGVYDYTARYTAGATRFLCPAEVDPALAERCAELALRVHEVLGSAGPVPDRPDHRRRTASRSSSR